MRSHLDFWNMSKSGRRYLCIAYNSREISSWRRNNRQLPTCDCPLVTAERIHEKAFDPHGGAFPGRGTRICWIKSCRPKFYFKYKKFSAFNRLKTQIFLLIRRLYTALILSVRVRLHFGKTRLFSQTRTSQSRSMKAVYEITCLFFRNKQKVFGGVGFEPGYGGPVCIFARPFCFYFSAFELA